MDAGHIRLPDDALGQQAPLPKSGIGRRPARRIEVTGAVPRRSHVPRRGARRRYAHGLRADDALAVHPLRLFHRRSCVLRRGVRPVDFGRLEAHRLRQRQLDRRVTIRLPLRGLDGELRRPRAELGHGQPGNRQYEPGSASRRVHRGHQSVGKACQRGAISGKEYGNSPPLRRATCRERFTPRVRHRWLASIRLDALRGGPTIPGTRGRQRGDLAGWAFGATC